MAALRRKKKNKINLVPLGEFEATSLGRVLKWLLSTFRVIVIIIEIIVMGAFLSRFWLDAENSDLNDEIKQKRARILASANFEDDFRDTQKRLRVLSGLSINQPASEVLDAIATTMPADIVLTSTSISDEGIRLAGSSLTEASIAQFIINLENNRVFRRAELASVSTGISEQELLQFTLTLFTTNTPTGGQGGEI